MAGCTALGITIQEPVVGPEVVMPWDEATVRAARDYLAALEAGESPMLALFIFANYEADPKGALPLDRP